MHSNLDYDGSLCKEPEDDRPVKKRRVAKKKEKVCALRFTFAKTNSYSQNRLTKLQNRRKRQNLRLKKRNHQRREAENGDVQARKTVKRKTQVYVIARDSRFCVFSQLVAI